MRTPRVVATITVVLALAGAAVGCSSGEESPSASSEAARAAYCSAWSDLVTTFGAFTDIDIINEGVDSVRNYVADVESSATALDEAATAQLGPVIEAFSASVETLGTTLTSPDLPFDRREEVRAAATEVDTAWNNLVDAFAADCPSVSIEGISSLQT